MRFSSLLPLFLLLSCTPDPQMDTTPYESAHPPVAAPRKRKQKRVALSTAVHERDYYGEIPGAIWLHSPASPLDNRSCERLKLPPPDPKTLKAVLKSYSRSLMACYKEGLSKNIKLRGKVAVTFLIRSDSTVRSCTVTAHLKDRAVGTCFCREILKMKGFKGSKERGCLNRNNYSWHLIPPN